MAECYMIEDVEVISRKFDMFNEKEDVVVVKLVHKREDV